MTHSTQSKTYLRFVLYHSYMILTTDIRSKTALHGIDSVFQYRIPSLISFCSCFCEECEGVFCLECKDSYYCEECEEEFCLDCKACFSCSEYESDFCLGCRKSIPCTDEYEHKFCTLDCKEIYACCSPKGETGETLSSHTFVLISSVCIRRSIGHII